MEISYGDHPLQKIRVFQHSPQNQHTLVLIHGGAWNDARNTHDDFLELLAILKQNDSMATINIVGINYRLTPEVRHPTHFHDIVTGISAVAQGFGVSRFSLAGHSVGATMVLQLLNYRQILEDGYGEWTNKAPVEIPDLHITLDTLFFIDGIYDMEDLVAEYGAPYKTFVDRAFVSESQYIGAAQVSWRKSAKFELGFEKAVVVQSTQDELLSLRQTHKFLGFLRGMGVAYEYYEKPWGAHEEVSRRRELAEAMGYEMR